VCLTTIHTRETRVEVFYRRNAKHRHHLQASMKITSQNLHLNLVGNQLLWGYYASGFIIGAVIEEIALKRNVNGC